MCWYVLSVCCFSSCVHTLFTEGCRWWHDNLPVCIILTSRTHDAWQLAKVTIVFGDAATRRADAGELTCWSLRDFHSCWWWHYFSDWTVVLGFSCKADLFRMGVGTGWKTPDRTVWVVNQHLGVEVELMRNHMRKYHNHFWHLGLSDCGTPQGLKGVLLVIVHVSPRWRVSVGFLIQAQHTYRTDKGKHQHKP